MDKLNNQHRLLTRTVTFGMLALFAPAAFPVAYMLTHPESPDAGVPIPYLLAGVAISFALIAIAFIHTVRHDRLVERKHKPPHEDGFGTTP